MSGPVALIVAPEQAGQKLVQYLGRVVAGEVPGSVFMRWIRTGQVRLDGKRAKPFDRVKEGQAVRLPPFAELVPGMAAVSVESRPVAPETDAPGSDQASPDGRPGHAAQSGGEDRSGGKGWVDLKPAERDGHRGPGSSPDRHAQPSSRAQAPARGQARDPAALLASHGLELLAATPEWLVIAKPAGLPVHPGSGWTDSVQTRLEKAFAGGVYVPVLAHRLDRDTSGALLAARTHAALTKAHEAIRRGEAVKEYLCWVRGKWTLSGTGVPVELVDVLAKEGPAGREKMVVKPGAGRGGKDAGKLSRLTATPLVIRPDRSLLAVVLHTGRTHQIRAQLASRGHPLAGDAKYGGGGGPMRLHAFRLSIGGDTFTCPPPWEGEWAAEVPGIGS